MAWVKDGTVTVTNGSATVAGSGTNWDAAVVLAGDAFLGPDGLIYEIASLNGSTELTLAKNYTGSNLSGGAYSIHPTQQRAVQSLTRMGALMDKIDTKVDPLPGVVAGIQAEYDAQEAAWDAEIDAKVALWQGQLEIVATTETIPGTPVAHTTYDPAMDSDGGAWTKKCQHLSWYQEARTAGPYLGVYADETAARAAPDYVDGAYYWDDGDLKFYVLSTGSGQTETVRAGSAEMPRLNIYAYVDRIVLMDADNGGMWMLFRFNDNNMIPASEPNRSMKAIAMLEGWIGVGYLDGLVTINFASDVATWFSANSGYGGNYNGSISQRNDLEKYQFVGVPAGLPTLVNVRVNDVAMTVLPDAPIDPVTGLKVPTIAVATDGGVTVIEHDGGIVNITATTANFQRVMSLEFLQDGTILSGWDRGGVRNAAVIVMSIPTAAVNATYPWNLPNVLRTYHEGATNTINKISLGTKLIHRRGVVSQGGSIISAAESGAGLALIHENPADPSKGMVNHVTADSVSGHMIGDTVLAALASTDDSDLVGGNILLGDNSTFDVGIGDWGPNGYGSPTLSQSSGRLVITSDGTTYTGAALTITGLTIGRAYYFKGDLIAGTYQGSAHLQISGQTGDAQQTANMSNGNTSLVGYFTAAATAHTLHAGMMYSAHTAGETVMVDNIEVLPADADHSPKNKGLIVNGTVARNADGYGPFSVDDFLEQPINPTFDRGTGDFLAYGLVIIPSDAVSHALFHRTEAGGNGGIEVYIDAAKKLQLRVTENDFGSAPRLESSGTVPVGVPVFIAVMRVSGVLYSFINDALQGTLAAAQNIDNTLATTLWGKSKTGIASPCTGRMKRWRFGATPATAEQIKYISARELKWADETLGGTSSAILDVCVDPITQERHVLTSEGHSVFSEMGTRISFTAGSWTKVSAFDGDIILT